MNLGRGLWLVALLSLAGCYSTTLMQEPRPLPQGGVRGAVGLAVSQAGISAQIAARVGLGAGTETRWKLSFPGNDGRALGGVEGGLNYQPYDSSLFAVFLMPHYRYYAIAEDYGAPEEMSEKTRQIHAAALPMLAVFHVRWYELFVGPDLHAGTRERRGFLGVGAHAGASVASGRFVHLTLETGLLATVAGVDAMRDESGARTQSVFTVGKLHGEVGIAISIGAPYRR